MELTNEQVRYINKIPMDEDQKQDLFVALLEAPALENPKAFPSYVWKTRRNLWRNARWVSNNRAKLHRENEEEIRKNTVGSRDTDDPFEILLGLEEIEARIAKLSPLVKSSMEKYWLEGMTPAAIAEEEGVPEGAIRQRLTRGRKELEYE